MSPILVRPVREQLEHDRIIRFLQGKYRRRYEVAVNPGAEQNVPVGTGSAAIYPDLVLLSQDRGHRLQGVIEVETGESVNHLEALAQWAHFAKLRASFQLYVPAGMVDVGRRLCEDNHIQVNEIWSYHSVGDQVRFTLVHRSREATPVAHPRTERRSVAVARRPPSRAANKPARSARAVKKPARSTRAPARSAKKRK